MGGTEEGWAFSKLGISSLPFRGPVRELLAPYCSFVQILIGTVMILAFFNFNTSSTIDGYLDLS